MVKVKAIMTKELVTVKPEATVAEASKVFAKNKVGSILVCEKDEPCGIITERDLVYNVLARELDPKKVLVKDIMSKPLVAIDENSEISEAAELMNAKNIRRIAIVDKKGKLAGIVTTSDIRRFVGEGSRFDLLKALHERYRG
ncbi:MAG: CBS domain-containing protein [Candidatus Bathyarchaeia archaeon]